MHIHVKIALMDSVVEVQEDVVSDPLKHLLSLDWNSSVTLTAIESNFEPSKSVKRVRFSDEVEKISYYSSDEKNLDTSFTLKENNDEGNNDIEMNSDLPIYPNENKTDILAEETEFTDFDEVENSVESVQDELKDNSLMDPNIETKISVQGVEDNVNENIDQNTFLLVNNYENSQLQSLVDFEEASDLNKVTTQVGNLSLENTSSQNITSVDPVSVPPHFDMFDVRNSMNKDELSSSANDNLSVTSKKRARSKLFNQKQSWILNSALTENSCYSNASELSSAVFKAWCDVKNKTKSVETVVSNEKKVSSKPTTTNRAYLTWKKSKTEAQKKAKKDKTSTNFPGMHQEISKNSKEEIEMAFKAWKKKKDEMLKQKMIEKFDKEQEQVVDSLMEKREKKLEADAAFNAWKQHKSHLVKMEKKKRAWVLQKKREEEEKKIARDREALVVYHMWLESKSLAKHDTFSPVKAKPPWTPPGK